MQDFPVRSHQPVEPVRAIANGFYFRAIESLISGEGIDEVARRDEELFSFLMDSIMLERYGRAALDICEMPLDSQVWRSEMRTLALIWKVVELKMHTVSKPKSED